MQRCNMYYVEWLRIWRDSIVEYLKVLTGEAKKDHERCLLKEPYNSAQNRNEHTYVYRCISLNKL
jgi:hypothetical protein